ncbi:MAG: CBS domain-containing protein [Dactylosporangium sp.]|nr:CBS domain-containing protein [Dactylosporangium sp.]
MAQRTVADVMTRVVVMMPAETTVNEAAKAMRARNFGDVVVTDGPTLAGVVTDRDIVIRGIANDRDPASTPLGEITSRHLVIIPDNASVDEAAMMMREHAVRRLLVCDPDRQLVGVISLGDVAREMEPQSTLGGISTAPPNG